MRQARMFTAVFLILSIAGYSGAQTVRCTTWNLQWFPNGSPNEAPTSQQEQRVVGRVQESFLNVTRIPGSVTVADQPFSFA